MLFSWSSRTPWIQEKYGKSLAIHTVFLEKYNGEKLVCGKKRNGLTTFLYVHNNEK